MKIRVNLFRKNYIFVKIIAVNFLPQYNYSVVNFFTDHKFEKKTDPKQINFSTTKKQTSFVEKTDHNPIFVSFVRPNQEDVLDVLDTQ